MSHFCDLNLHISYLYRYWRYIYDILGGLGSMCVPWKKTKNFGLIMVFSNHRWFSIWVMKFWISENFAFFGLWASLVYVNQNYFFVIWGMIWVDIVRKYHWWVTHRQKVILNQKWPIKITTFFTKILPYKHFTAKMTFFSLFSDCLGVFFAIGGKFFSYLSNCRSIS